MASPLPLRRLRILQVTGRRAKYVADGPRRQRNHSWETTQTNRDWVAHWVDSRESSLLRRLERGREIGR